MTTRAQIIAEYERQEQAHGGLDENMVQVWIRRAAIHAGVSYDEAAEVITSRWNMIGVG